MAPLAAAPILLLGLAAGQLRAVASTEDPSDLPLATPPTASARSPWLERPELANWLDDTAAAGVPTEARFSRLDGEVAALLDQGQGLAAKLTIELDLLATESESEPQRIADRAHQTLADLLDTLAVEASLEHPDLAPRPLIDWLLTSLDRRAVRAMAGGDNRTLLEVFEGRTAHPGTARPGLAHWIDCDTATLTVFAALERLGEVQPDRDLSDRLRIVSYADHMALALLPAEPGGPTLVGDMNTAATGPRRRVRVEWHERQRYEELFRQRTGEQLVLLRDWEEALANSWDVGAATLIHRKEYARARLWALRAVTLNPKGAGGYNSLALALRGLDRDQDALLELARAIELRPLGGRLYSNLASLLLDLGDLDAASDAADWAIELMPELLSARLMRRAIRYRLGDREGAQRDFDAFLELIADRRPSEAPHAAAPTGPPAAP